MLETRDLTIRFGGHVAVDHVSCRFEPGTLTAIVGPNGAGKTTYFNLISGQLPASEGRVLLDGEDITALPAPLRTRARPRPRVPADAAVPEPDGAGERAPGGAGARAAHGGGLNLFAVWLDRQDWIDEAQALLRRGAPGRQARRRAPQPAARRPAQARGGAADGARAQGLHVRRTDRRHERRRGAGHARPDPRAEGAQGPHRSCWSSTRWTWCASWPTASSCCTTAQLVADGEPAAVIASPVVQQAYLGIAPAEDAAHERPHAARSCSGVHTHIGAYHILHGVDLAVPRGRGDDAAGPQRRRQDDDAAHDHGPVAGVAGRACASSGQPIDGAARTPDIAQLRHRLRAREHGHLHRPDGEGEPACSPRARRAAPTSSTRARLDWIFGLFPALKKFWLYPAGKLSRRAEADAGDRARHRRAARAAADRRAEQGPGAVDHRQPDRAPCAS